MRLRLLNLVVRAHELKGAAYQVMLALAWNSSATSECSISISDLAVDAHLTKKSVIRALQVLTSPYSAADRRSILTKAKQGIGVRIPNTYLIHFELLRDLSRRRRYPPATTGQGRRASDLLTPGRGATNNGETGNAATLVERRETRTLRAQTNQKEDRYSGLSDSIGPILLEDAGLFRPGDPFSVGQPKETNITFPIPSRETIVRHATVTQSVSEAKQQQKQGREAADALAEETLQRAKARAKEPKGLAGPSLFPASVVERVPDVTIGPEQPYGYFKSKLRKY